MNHPEEAACPPGAGGTLRLPPRTQGPRAPGLLALLPTYLAVRYPGVLTRDHAETYAAGVAAAREEWTPNFGGTQFTLGRAWYTHLEEDREDEYFADAAASDARVERWAPGLQQRMMAILRRLMSARVVLREGWCGPGVHVFQAGSPVARDGGDVHFDVEGLTDAQLSRRARALTLVLTLQPAGGLQVWDQMYAGEAVALEPPAEVASALLEYEPGELVVIDSYRLHQIMPFQGSADRITATVHLVEEGDVWEAWF